jgi:serine/threonine protein phosphatase 1
VTPAAACAPDGWTVYAVGDIHGRIDLFETLLDAIDDDLESLPPGRQAALVLLGDYIDRGPDSRAVIELAASIAPEAGFEVTALRGNHEQTLLDFLDDAKEGPVWGEFGGLATLASYGVAPPRSRADPAEWEAAREALQAALPLEHRRFLADLPLMQTYGDYVFVHAGLRPGVPLAAQDPHDLMWIRDAFTAGGWRGPPAVVHGHSPVAEPVLDPWRINVDTGAYATGRLTAVRLEGTERRLLAALPGRRRG